MDSSILFALNWNSTGELASEDLEFVLSVLTRTMESGAEELRVLLGRSAA